MDKRVLSEIKDKIKTPCYVFDTDIFTRRAGQVRQAFGENVSLCYSIKANPFLTGLCEGCFDNLEVCSPGELRICQSVGVAPEKIIFSGVNKSYEDIENAFNYGVKLFTAESRRHLELINEVSGANNTVTDVILRLAHGSQFGIDVSELRELIKCRADFANVHIIGLHYFTGTQKTKPSKIEKELASLDELLCELKESFGFEPAHIEYGTGLGVEYYKDFTDETELALLDEASVFVRAFAEKYPFTVEMGRFFAASCGFYMTSAADIKSTDGINYVICDGGINQLNYYGQNMAMKIPPIETLDDKKGEITDYCLCGSLCTTADVLIRKVSLPRLEIGDTLVFSKCGAYSMCEGLSIFLSRSLPAVAAYSETNGIKPLRGHTETFTLNFGGESI